MMTMQTPQGTWNPTVPTNGVNGHTRIQDALSGVNAGIYGYANIPAGVANPLGAIPQAYGTVNPFMHTAQPFGQTFNPYATTLNPLAQAYATPYQTAGYGLSPVQSYATAWNQPAAIHPFALAYNQTTPFGGFVNPYVNPFAQAINPAAAWQTQSLNAINPFATQNPYQTVNAFPTINPFQTVNPVQAINPAQAINPIQAIHPFAGVSPMVSPFVSGCLSTAAINPLTGVIPTQTINPFVGAFNTLPQTATAHPAFGLGIVNPLVAQQIANATLGHTTGYSTTIDPITGTIVPVGNPASGSFPLWTGQSTIHPVGLGVSPFQFDANLGWNLWSQPAARSWIGQHPLQAIAWQNALHTSRLFNPFNWNGIPSNACATPFVNSITNPFIANTVSPWATGLNTLNPFVRNFVNQSLGLCGLHGQTPSICTC